MNINLGEVSDGTKVKNAISIVRHRLNDSKGFHFDPIAHKYTVDGMQLTSCTELISKYTKPFDTAIISEMSAKKYAREGNEKLANGKEVRRLWKMKGEHASSLGTAGHAFCLMYWLDNSIKPITQLDVNAKKVMDNIMQKYTIIEMEMPRGNKKHKIGYTIDILMQDKISGEIVLGDFKFSSKFTDEQNKELKGKHANYMLAPFDSFREVAHDKGSIQLEMYKRFLKEDLDIDVNLNILIHIDGLSITPFYGDKGYKVYIAKECIQEVDAILAPLESGDSIIDLI